VRKDSFCLYRRTVYAKPFNTLRHSPVKACSSFLIEYAVSATTRSVRIGLCSSCLRLKLALQFLTTPAPCLVLTAN
jgi:hypothetical protein